MALLTHVTTPLVAACLMEFLLSPARAQDRRLWVFKEPASVVEYDPATFAPKQTVAVPPAIAKAPGVLQINHKGQMLFAPNPDDPSPDVGKNSDEFWFWDGQTATTLHRESLRVVTKAGSNQKVTESFPTPLLSADGVHLYWFTNQFSKLERDRVDLAVTTSFSAWRTNLAGKERQGLVSFEFPECRCTTGSCTETCPEAHAWAADEVVAGSFFVTKLIPGQTETKYLDTSLWTGDAAAWHPTPWPENLQRPLDAGEDGAVVVSAIPDSGCCGWENQSNDQTILFSSGKRLVLFDERQQYQNPDYDVSFYTTNAKISPDLTSVAMTVETTAKPNAPIQLSEQGQGNPTESQRIHKAMAELPAVLVVSATEPGKRIAFVPHAMLVGWLNDRELLLVENHFLVAYTLGSGARRKSQIKVSDLAFAFVR